MLAIYFFLVMVLATTATKGEERQQQFYCGRKLVHIYSLMCASLENNSQENSIDRVAIEPAESDTVPWMTRRYIKAMSAAARSKHMAGLVEECCRKPCHVNQLLSYC